MTRPVPSSSADIDNALTHLEDWALVDDHLRKTFEFPSFLAALDFMQRVGRRADAGNHHPDWRNLYNRVEVSLQTHDVSAVTVLDFELAALMNAEAAATPR